MRDRHEAPRGESQENPAAARKKRGRKALEICLGDLPESPIELDGEPEALEAYAALRGHLAANPKVIPADAEIVMMAARQRARLAQLYTELRTVKKVVTNKGGAYPKCSPIFAEIRALEKDYRGTLRELNLTPAARAAKREPLTEGEKAGAKLAGALAAGAADRRGPMARLFGSRAV